MPDIIEFTGFVVLLVVVCFVSLKLRAVSDEGRK